MTDDAELRWAKDFPNWAVTLIKVAVVVLLAALGSWLGLLVAGQSTASLGPVITTMQVKPLGSSQTTVDIAPLGTLELDTHAGPAGLDISIRSVDLPAARELVSDPTKLANLDDEVLADLQSTLMSAALRALLAATLGAVALGALVLRDWRRVLIVGGTSAGLTLGSYGLAAATFDRQAISEPTYTGLLAGAPQLVGSAEAIAQNFDLYAAQLGALVTNVTRLYDASLSLPTFNPQEGTIRILHVSDLHLSPTAWDVIDSVAEQYDVDVIVDSGDIADHGTAPESRYVQDVGGLDRPYVFVRGNHDSVLTEAAVAAQPNAVVLDSEPVTVAGIRFFGAPDPRFTPDQTTRGTASEQLQQATARLADQAGELDPRADVIVFHDPTNAQLLDGTAPLVLAGHAHRRSTVLLPEGTRVMVQGSTGGAGLRALEGEEPTPVMLTVLYLDADTKALQAWDNITLGGLGLTSAQIERFQAEPQEAEPVEEEARPDE